MKIKFLYLFLIFTLFYLTGVQSLSQNQQPIVLKYADSLVGFRGENTSIREWEGNVELYQGDVFLSCDKVIQYLATNRAELIGNVHINQQDLDLYTPKGTYNGNTKIAHAYNGVKITDRKTTLNAKQGIYYANTQIADFNQNVKIEDDSVEIYSDKLIYHKSNRNSFAYGNVMIKGKYSKAYLFGDTVKHFPNLRHTYVGGSPRLFQIDSIITGIRNELDTTETEDDSNSKQSAMSLRFDTLSVKSRIMESYQRNDMEQDDEIFYFIDSVEIVKGGLAARADTAVYNKTIGKIEMKGRPVVWYDSTQMFADSIIVYVPEMKLAKLHSFGNSVVLSRDDTTDLSKINQIVGNEILIKFENDSINAIFSFGDAKSLYFMESDSVSGGAQRSSCDSLSVLFEFGEVSEINWLGGISGEFFPEELINEPVSLYLPGFKLINNRPRKMSFTLLRYE